MEVPLQSPQGYLCDPIIIKIPAEYRLLPDDGKALIGTQKIRAQTWCSNSKDMKDKRMSMYKKDHQTGEYYDIKIIAKFIYQDAILNAKIMTVSIVVFGGLGSLAWLAPAPLAGPLGTGLGVAAGIGVGTAIIANCVNERINVEIELSEEFVKWRTEAIQKKVYPLFKEFLEDNHFEEFFCPISLDICEIPMLAPDGHTYDKAHIEEYIAYSTDKADVLVDSPFRGTKFCKNDLILDIDFMRKMIGKADYLYNLVMNRNQDAITKYGLEMVTKNTKNIMDTIQKKVKAKSMPKLEQDLKDKKIDIKERDEKLRQLLEPYSYEDVKVNEYKKRKPEIHYTGEKQAEEFCTIF